MEKVLVTGGLGYVGSRLVPRLLEKNKQVTVLDNLMYENCQNTLLTPVQGKSLTRHPNFKGFIEGDIRDEEIVAQAMKDQDAIIHLAAIVGAPACDKHKEQATAINVGGTENVIRNLKDGQKLLFASTGSIYGKIDDLCLETTPINPQSLYGRNKHEAEQKVLEAGGVAYRFATAFGLAPRLRMDLLANDFSHKLVSQKHLDVYEAGARRTFIHVDDMARSFIFGLENYEEMRGEAYNVGNDSMNCTKEELAELIKKSVESKLGTNVYLWTEQGDSRFDPDKRDYEVSYDKIKGKGFTTKTTLQEGVDELVDFFSVFKMKNPFSNI